MPISQTSPTSRTSRTSGTNPAQPPQHASKHVPHAARWWQFGHVWLVIAGPLCVVLAGIATFYLAHTRLDPVVTTHQTPAVQARNHVATQK